MEINQMVKQVHLLRLAYAELRSARDAAQAAFEQANAELFALVKRATDNVTQAESELREAALAIFNATGTRKPCPGVEVKDFTELSYRQELALEWAKGHSMALALDKKAFEALVKAGALKDEGFVAVTVNPKATIATDLGKALEGSKA